MRTYFQDFALVALESDDPATEICVEYFYADGAACVKEAWLKSDETTVVLTEAEDERMCAWIMEHRYHDDRSER